MKTLYFISSPFQYLSAVERLNKYPKENAYFIVLLGDKNKKPNSFNQLSAVVESNCKVEKEERLISYSSYLELELKLIKVYIRLRLISFEKVCLGDFRDLYGHLLIRGLRVKQAVLLDDGAATIIILNRYLALGVNYPEYSSKVDKIRNLIYQVLGMNKKFQFDWQVSSIFNLQKIKKRTKVIEKFPIKKEKVYFFGSKYSEANILSVDVELFLLKKVKEFYASKELFYIPHRGDSLNKLNNLTLLGYIVKDLKQPAELYFANSIEPLPDIISGFWTTAIYSLSRDYEFSSVDSFDITRFVDTLTIKDNAISVYNYFQSVGINVRVI
tara:strand:- start:7103 stop:8083 length:981 start_codon:yes stop_codon:yes gene_type:complete